MILLILSALLYTCEAVTAPFAVGRHQVCYTSVSGGGVCKGHHSSAALGNGVTWDHNVDQGYVNIEFDVEGEDIADIVSGGDHVCLLSKPSSDLYCWGYNGNGQLGLGHRDPAGVPGIFPVGAPVLSFDLGKSHTCIAVSNGTLYCCGYGFGGTIGDGDGSLHHVESPFRVNVPGAVEQVACGAHKTFAIDQSGRVWAWGYGDIGFGDGPPVTTPRRLDVFGDGAIATVAAGGETSCAIDSQSKLYCWGKGISEASAGSVTPTLMKFGSGFVRLVNVFPSNESPVMAIDKETGLVWGFAQNAQNRLGIDPEMTGTVTPTQVVFPSDAGRMVYVSVGSVFAPGLAIDEKGQLYWFGLWFIHGVGSPPQSLTVPIPMLFNITEYGNLYMDEEDTEDATAPSSDVAPDGDDKENGATPTAEVLEDDYENDVVPTGEVSSDGSGETGMRPAGTNEEISEDTESEEDGQASLLTVDALPIILGGILLLIIGIGCGVVWNRKRNAGQKHLKHSPGTSLRRRGSDQGVHRRSVGSRSSNRGSRKLPQPYVQAPSRNPYGPVAVPSSYTNVPCQPDSPVLTDYITVPDRTPSQASSEYSQLELSRLKRGKVEPTVYEELQLSPSPYASGLLMR